MTSPGPILLGMPIASKALLPTAFSRGEISRMLNEYDSMMPFLFISIGNRIPPLTVSNLITSPFAGLLEIELPSFVGLRLMLTLNGFHSIIDGYTLNWRIYFPTFGSLESVKSALVVCRVCMPILILFLRNTGLSAGVESKHDLSVNLCVVSNRMIMLNGECIHWTCIAYVIATVVGVVPLGELYIWLMSD